MANARTLQPDQKIARYHVVGPLGAGGMGEVYLAHDESLARNVALKILPPELVRSEERVRRFVLEARSASSLNHPNIVTIYDIGQDRIRAADGAEAAAGEAPVHFISMELVNGVTLGAKIHDEKADLRSLLGWLAQAAEGIAKAHAAGIVHRDLKPGNIMVTRDGFAKVLDFGLAKLSERRASDPDATAAPTVGGPATSEGVVLGTVGYMSPEQVQARAVDHRSDVFSFGCILYEAATRKRPFAAESSVEVMHKILHDKPEPIEELNPRAPAELRRLIRRCLAKDPEQRVQSMKDVAIELREIVDEFETLSASASSGSGTRAAAPAPARRGPWIVITVGALVVVAIVAAIAVRMLRPGGPRGFENPTITTVTSRGDVGDVALSPDGRYLAFTSGPPAGRSIWVRQIATGSDVQVLPPQTVAPLGLTFSPDGNYLYYLHTDPERRGFRALYQMPTLGGESVKRAYDIDTPVGFSPDGRQVCFARGVPATGRLAVVLLDLASGRERLLASSPWTGAPTRARPSWSPRGDRIALIESGAGTFGLTKAWIYRVSDGRRDSLRTTLPPGISSVSWMPDGRSLALTCVDLTGVPRLQVFVVSVPGGLARRVTNDFDDYDQISSSAAGDLLAAVREERVVNLWVSDLAGTAKQLTFATGPEHTIVSVGVTPEGRLVYSAAGEHDVAVFATGADGGAPTPLTTVPGYARTVRGARGAAVFQWIDPQNGFHLWRAGVGGGDAQALTQGAGESLVDVSRDGNTVVYERADQPNRQFTMPAAGGAERLLVSGADRGISLSPDGSGLLVMKADTVSGVYQFDIRIARVADGRLMPSLGLPARAADSQWTADGRSVSFIDSTDPSRNVWRKPVDGGPAVQVTHLAEGQVGFHRWSPDGRWLLLDVIRGTNDDLWLAPAAGGAPRRLTTFPTGHVFSASWLPNSQAIAISYGTDSWDAVLIRNAR